MKRFFDGHNGWGDNLHQRAAIRALLERGDEVWLRTSVPCIYQDLAATARLHFVATGTVLRTQRQNAERESGIFEGPPAGVGAEAIAYTPSEAKAAGSVLAAITRAFRVDLERPDFRMPVQPEWRAKVPADLPEGPRIVYRPPITRLEWMGTATRNPDPTPYGEIFDAIRGDYAVVSVAHLAPGEEWIVGDQPEVDREYHQGEMDFEALAAVVADSDFVYTTPGVLTVLAQALSVPCITVFGGFERATSFSGGAVHSPWLPIETISPCECWSHYHRCEKRIDVPAAIAAARAFMKEHDGRRTATA